MPLVPAICTQCGAQIEVDEKTEASICSHCGTAFITEKAINQYTVTHNNLYNISNSTVIVQKDVEQDIDFMLKNVEGLLKIENYSEAYKRIEEIQEKYPVDYRAWEISIQSHLKRSQEELGRIALRSTDMQVWKKIDVPKDKQDLVFNIFTDISPKVWMKYDRTTFEMFIKLYPNEYKKGKLTIQKMLMEMQKKVGIGHMGEMSFVFDEENEEFIKEFMIDEGINVDAGICIKDVESYINGKISDYDDQFKEDYSRVECIVGNVIYVNSMWSDNYIVGVNLKLFDRVAEAILKGYRHPVGKYVPYVCKECGSPDVYRISNSFGWGGKYKYKCNECGTESRHAY